jgi:predicted RNase H-like HicB family nuclease
MKINVIVHKAEEGGFWAEVPAVPGCCSQGDSMEELKENIAEAIKGCLSVGIPPKVSRHWHKEGARVLAIAV